jgi:hypothetical protein
VRQRPAAGADGETIRHLPTITALRGRNGGSDLATADLRPAPSAPTRPGFSRWALAGSGVALCVLLLLLSAARIVATIEGVPPEGDDFTPYWNGASNVAAGASPYAWLAENRPQILPDYIYPPLLAVLLAPLTRALDYETARWAWLAFSVLCLAASIGLIAHASHLTWRGPRALALVPCLALLPATTLALAIGQLSPQLLLAVTAAYAALAARRESTAGAFVALGASLKSFPALLGGYLLLRREWRGAIAALGVSIALLALTILVVGWEPHWTYLTRVVPAQTHWQGGPFNVSATGVFTRLLVDNPFTTPVLHAPALAQALIVGATLALLGATASVVWRAAPRGAGAAFAATVVASLLVSPINGQYNLVIVLLPLAVAAAGVQRAWPRGLRWLLLAAVLLGLPVEWYELWPVYPMPWRSGWGTLLAAGPFFGLLALWGLLVRQAAEAPGTAPPPTHGA